MRPVMWLTWIPAWPRRRKRSTRAASTSGLSEPQPRARRKYTPATVAGIVAIALFVLLFVAVGVLLVLNLLV